MSPTATLTVDDAREAVLATADDLFYRRGIGAVTLADIRDHSGVSLRRLYSMYPHKSDLVAGWLTQRHDTWMAMFIGGIDDRLETGSTSCDAIFDSLGAWLVATDYRGCGFINTLAETGDVTAEHRAIIRRHKQSLIDALPRFTAYPASLAVLIDGAIVQASVFSSIDPVAASRVAAAPLVVNSLPKD